MMKYMEIRSLVYSHLLDKVEWATTHAMINSVIFPANDWDFGDDLINCYEIHNGKLYSYLTSQENLNFELVLSFLLKFYWYKSENFILSLIKIPEIKLILQGMDIRLLSGSHYSIDILKELVVNDNRKIYQLLNYIRHRSSTCHCRNTSPSLRSTERCGNTSRKMPALADGM